MPDAFWDAEKGSFKLDAITGASEAAAKYAKLTEGAVDDPSKVDFAGLIKDLKAEDGGPLKDPYGNVIELDAASPLLQGAAKIFAENGIGKSVQSSLVRALIESQIADAKTVIEQGQAEIAKLGANGSARISAVQNFFKEKGGEPAAAIVSRINTAAEFEALEKLVAMVTGPAAGANAGGAAPVTDAVSVLFPNAKRAS